MLLDTYTLKSGLSSLLPAPAPAGFVKRVNASFAKIESLLKTLQVQPSPPETLVQAYLIHIADQSNTNFRKILDIKGIRSRQEQNHLVELFQVHRASDRHAPNLQQNNPILNTLQPPTSSSSGSVSQGLGLGNLSTSAAASIGGSSSRFDPSMLGSAIISAAKDGVDRFGNPSLGMSGTGTPSGGTGPPAISVSGTSSPTPVPPGPTQQTQTQATSAGESSPSVNLNENLKNIGKFFRRDLGGFGGRFGRGSEEPSGS